MVIATEADKAVRSIYMGAGEFEWPWGDAAEAIARELVPGKDVREFLAQSESDQPVSGSWDFFNDMVAVGERRSEVAILVAPAVQAICVKAMAEHWTEDEFDREMQRITDEYRPRVA